MSDRKDPYEESEPPSAHSESVIPTIPASELIRYFIDKGVKGRFCPECETDSWTVLDSEKTRGFLFFVLTDSDTTDVDHKMDVLPILCDNCGFIRHFARRKIADWLAKNPPDDPNAVTTRASLHAARAKESE